MSVVDVSVLIVRQVGNVRVCRMVVRMRRMLKAGEDRLDQLLQIQQCHVAPDRAAEFFVPIQDGVARGPGFRANR